MATLKKVADITEELFMEKEVASYIRSIKDFPKPGIVFRDITTVLKSPEALKLAIDSMQEKLEGIDFDLVVGPEARGFLFGVPIAYNTGVGFVPIRKKGKLPSETVEETYDLEYGSATIEVHKDGIKPGDRVVIIDDLLATGGTTKAMVNLVEKLGGQVVRIVCLIELCGLKGRDLVPGYSVETVVQYPGA